MKTSLFSILISITLYLPLQHPSSFHAFPFKALRVDRPGHRQLGPASAALLRWESWWWQWWGLGQRASPASWADSWCLCCCFTMFYVIYFMLFYIVFGVWWFFGVQLLMLWNVMTLDFSPFLHGCRMIDPPIYRVFSRRFQCVLVLWRMIFSTSV